MCAHSIRRRLTPDLADAQDERHAQRYEELFAEVEDDMRAEWEREFGPDPGYKPDGARIHAVVMAKMT